MAENIHSNREKEPALRGEGSRAFPPRLSPENPSKRKVADLQPRKLPTLIGALQELGRKAWEGIAGFSKPRLKRPKKHPILDRKPQERGAHLSSPHSEGAKPSFDEIRSEIITQERVEPEPEPKIELQPEPAQETPAPPITAERPPQISQPPSEAEPLPPPAASAAREPSKILPTKGGITDFKLRRAPTVIGLLQELGRRAWGSATALIQSQVKRLKRPPIPDYKPDPLILTEQDLLGRRPEVRSYVFISTIVHLLIFLPLIHYSMLQRAERKPPVYVRIMDIPPPAKKIDKTKKKADTQKTTKRKTKVVKARGPRPAPRPVAKPTPIKRYVTPKKVLVAKATRAVLRAPTAPKVPKLAPSRLEAARPRAAPSRLPKETVARVTAPTKPVILPETIPAVTTVVETVRRQTPKATRPSVLTAQVLTLPDTEGRVARLSEAFPKEFQVSDRLSQPTAAPPLPSSQAPSPQVLGQIASVASEAAPESATPLAPRGVASSRAVGASSRPVDDRRTAQDVEARLGREVGPVSPTQPVSFGDTNELSPVGSAPTEFQEEITVPLNSEDPRFKEYLDSVKRRILEVWHYPYDAEPGLGGKVGIQFSIERDGSVSRVNIITPSRHIVLDIGATDAMHRASPFLPLPREFNTNRLIIVGGFRYN